MVPFGRYPAPHALKRTKRPETRNPSVAVGSNPDFLLGAARSLPPSADIGPGGQSVGQAAQFCLAALAPRQFDAHQDLMSPVVAHTQLGQYSEGGLLWRFTCIRPPTWETLGQLNSKILRTELSQSVAPCAKLSVANW